MVANVGQSTTGLSKYLSPYSNDNPLLYNQNDPFESHVRNGDMVRLEHVECVCSRNGADEMIKGKQNCSVSLVILVKGKNRIRIRSTAGNNSVALKRLRSRAS